MERPFEAERDHAGGLVLRAEVEGMRRVRDVQLSAIFVGCAADIEPARFMGPPLRLDIERRGAGVLVLGLVVRPLLCVTDV